MACSEREVRVLAHSNAINFRGVRQIVVAIQLGLADGKRDTNSRHVVSVERSSCKVLVEVIHHRDDGCKVGRSTGKEESHILEDLTTLCERSVREMEGLETDLQCIVQLLRNLPLCPADFVLP